MKESLKNLERRHVKFEEATSLADAEVRDQLMKQSAAFSAELARTSERLDDRARPCRGHRCAPTRWTPRHSPARSRRWRRVSPAAADARRVRATASLDHARGAADGGATEFATLRQLLVGPERQQLDELTDRVEEVAITPDEARRSAARGDRAAREPRRPARTRARADDRDGAPRIDPPESARHRDGNLSRARAGDPQGDRRDDGRARALDQQRGRAQLLGAGDQVAHRGVAHRRSDTPKSSSSTRWSIAWSRCSSFTPRPDCCWRT